VLYTRYLFLKRLGMARVKDGLHILRTTRSSTNRMSRICLYSPAGVHHRTLTNTHVPSAEGRRLTWPGWMIACPGIVTHPKTNRGSSTHPLVILHSMTNPWWESAVTSVQDHLPKQRLRWAVYHAGIWNILTALRWVISSSCLYNFAGVNLRCWSNIQAYDEQCLCSIYH